MVANETGPGSLCCLSWQSVPWLVLPALELTGCQAPCACVCMCVCILVRACGLASRSSAETNAVATQVGISACVSLRSLLAVGGPARAHCSGAFFKPVFLWQPLGFRLRSFVSKASAGPVAFLKKGQRTYRTLCVYDCAVLSCCELLLPRNRDGVKREERIEACQVAVLSQLPLAAWDKDSWRK